MVQFGLTTYSMIDGSFWLIGASAYFWSSTTSTTGNCVAWYRELYYPESYTNRNDNNKFGGFSVRCVKD